MLSGAHRLETPEGAAVPRPERPLDGSTDAIAGFAGDLRRLREKAGSPGYRELAGRAHYSASTLSEAAGGRRLPSLEVTLAYVRACDGDVEEWETRWRQVAADTTASRAAEADDVPTGEQAPYVGLQSFGPQDAHRFHGRDRLLARLTKAVREQRLVIVVGASGAGKSSLLRAGLVATARSGALADHQPWPDIVINPGPHPLESCAVGLATRLSVTSAGLHTTLVEHPRALALASRQVLADHDENTELLFVVDQFEEVFTLCRDDERDRFVDQLVATAADPTCRIRIVLGVRADFYGHCARYPELVAALQEAQVLVGPMTSDELREAITRPAVDAGCRVETALLFRLVADAVGQPGSLPLLSHALLETWRRRHGTTLTLAAYDATGGIQNAIAHTAELAYLALSPAQQGKARQVFERLIALGEGTEDTKRRLPRTEFDHADDDIAIVLERLAAARLLVLDESGIEIAHEALIRSWPRLRDWLAEDREGLRIHRHLTEATNAWETLGRDEGALYRGARLSIADDWAVTRTDSLTTREREFLDTSRALRDREQASARRRTRRLRQLVALLVVLLVLTSATVVYAVDAGRTATDQRNIALSQTVANQAAVLRDTTPALAAQLALAAYRLAPTEEARSSLLSTFATPYATQLLGHTNNSNAVAFHPNGKLTATAAWDNKVRLWSIADRHRPVTVATITAHTDNVLGLAFSPDGRVLATGSWDHTVRLWDVTDPRRPTELTSLSIGAGELKTLAFSPDGRTLASVSSDQTIRLWDVTDSGTVSFRQITERSEILGLAFSPDGRTLATGARESHIRLWDITGRGEPKELRTIAVTPRFSAAVAFSPDGRTLATVTGENQNILRLWDVTDLRRPTELATITGHADAIRAVAFSPDGRAIATVGSDRTVRLWHVADPRRPHSVIILLGHTDVVTSVTFSPDGRTLATTSDDDTVRLWDLPGPLAASHPHDVCTVRFTADGRTLATGSKDGTVLLTDLTDPVNPRQVADLAGHTDGACGAVLHPDGRTLITGSWDGTVRRWDITDRHEPGAPVTISRHKDEIDAVALNPDGRTLAVAGDNATVRLLDLGAPGELATLTGHTDDIHALAFSHDGNLLATTSWDHTVRLWDVTEPRRPAELAVITGHTQAVLAVAFSPNKRILVTSSPDRTIRLWDITDPRTPRESAHLNGHTDSAHGVAFSPDGRTLATASNDHTARLWDLTNPAEPREHAVLTGHTNRVRTVAFGPDGHTLVTGSTDQTARLWETDPERVASRICEVAHPRITSRQWEQFLPGIDYQPPCG
jgi:WD40 repeat protein/energy-coupling factor transporter ATP-binding protein EcfA2